jgi:hypothetical protein
LKLALKSEGGDAFSDLWLLMRIDGMVVPPAIARQLATRGLLVTNAEGRVSLEHIRYIRVLVIYEMAASFEAPISVRVLTGENDATVKFKARR